MRPPNPLSLPGLIRFMRTVRLHLSDFGLLTEDLNRANEKNVHATRTFFSLAQLRLELLPSLA